MNNSPSVFAKKTLTKKELANIRKNVSRSNFVEWLKHNYHAIRCYHAARPTNIDLYFDNGFRPSDLQKSFASFEILLKEIGYKGPVDVQETMELFEGKSNRFIYFILDDYDFIDLAPHYWIYGSEFMLCLAQNTAYHIKEHLRNTGTPTIFACDIPFSEIDDRELLSLHDRILDATGTIEQMRNNIFSNYSIIIEGHLDGAYISGHAHPTARVYDAHDSRYYTNHTQTCSRCAM
ncbi:hypothetical protein [Mucilaginibacter polytrichastri]|uniref:Uncharacterized protein n=1 Tax=Mucilaginibacter polytrichastri TaxID=1302689 RepID=A0A1Q6A262_9SPHI|nr:hypothetical protein [Mucilaginibacter polytrichastri]OKS88100.1 hypothetical protein RG47T_3564 [Mucilaginibacter polytrichastri]SFT09733.1 hypothetical protein SAMN04487890_110141 [Mucilaginibacter polytrichastri]